MHHVGKLALIVCLFLASNALADGKRYALLIGINQYDSESLTQLKFAENDIDGLAKGFEAASYKVKLLTVSSGTKDNALQPTRANISRTFKELAKGCAKEDTLLFAFAGHGIQFEGNPAAFLCPKDAKPDAKSLETLLSLEDVYTILNSCNATGKIMLVDAGPREKGGAGVTGDKSPSPPKGVAALFSCSSGEQSLSNPVLKHGLFFNSVRLGFAREALNGNDEITIGSLADYVVREVSKNAATIAKELKQTPVLRGEAAEKSIVLALHPDAPSDAEWKEYLDTWNKGLGTEPFLKKYGAKRFASWKKAADAGSAKGAMLAADCYEFGAGVEKNPKESARMYEWSARRGNTFAMVGIGICCAKGFGVTEDKKEAVRWFRKSAELGDAGGMQSLSGCFLTGAGVFKDEREAFYWSKKSAELGHVAAMYSLAMLYQAGLGVKQDLRESFRWLRKCGEVGFSPAFDTLGRCYLIGAGVRKDVKEGVRWYQKGAELNSADCIRSLGACYIYGLGVDKDEKEGLRLYRKAIDLGDARAMNDLGECYLSGEGVELDNDEAFRWFRKSADLGDSAGMLNAGKCYLDGIGTSKNIKEATKWLGKAADKGHPEAKQILKGLDD